MRPTFLAFLLLPAEWCSFRPAPTTAMTCVSQECNAILRDEPNAHCCSCPTNKDVWRACVADAREKIWTLLNRAYLLRLQDPVVRRSRHRQNQPNLTKGWTASKSGVDDAVSWPYQSFEPMLNRFNETILLCSIYSALRCRLSKSPRPAVMTRSKRHSES